MAILDLLEPEHELTDLENAYKTRFKYYRYVIFHLIYGGVYLAKNYRMDVTSKHDMDSVFTNVVKDFGQIDKW